MIFRNNYSYLNLLPSHTYSLLLSKKKTQNLIFTSFSFSNSKTFFLRFKSLKNSFSDKSKFVKFVPLSIKLFESKYSNNFFFFYDKKLSLDFFKFFLSHQLLYFRTNYFYTLSSRFQRGSFINNKFISFPFLNEKTYLQFYKTSSIHFLKNDPSFSISNRFLLKDPMITLLRIKFFQIFFSISLKIIFKI